MSTTTGAPRLSGPARELMEETVAFASPVDAVLRLVGELRAVGAPVSTAEAMDAVRALPEVGVLPRQTVRRALRCTLLKDSTHAAAFDCCFDRVFARPRPAEPATGVDPVPNDPGKVADALADATVTGDTDRVEQLAAASVHRWAGVGDGDRSAGHHTQRLLRTLSLDRVLRVILERGAAVEHGERRLRGAQARAQVDELRALLTRLVTEETAARGDTGPDAVADPGSFDPDRSILAATPDELDALRDSVRPLARRIAARLRRERSGGSTLDMRRTIRASMSTGGVPVDPCARRRTPHRPELRVLCDVSGSMAGYARFALTLVHALQDEFPRTRAWVFVDGIVEVTDVLRGCGGRLDPHQLLGRRGLTAHDGRSDYAAAFGTFLERWADSLTARCTVLVIGDGRSHDRAPATRQLDTLARAARRVYWLNPEPRTEWGTDDSHIELYRPRCARVFEVATLSQLEQCVAEIGRSAR